MERSVVDLRARERGPTMVFVVTAGVAYCVKSNNASLSRGATLTESRVSVICLGALKHTAQAKFD